MKSQLGAVLREFADAGLDPVALRLRVTRRASYGIALPQKLGRDVASNETAGSNYADLSRQWYPTTRFNAPT